MCCVPSRAALLLQCTARRQCDHSVDAIERWQGEAYARRCPSGSLSTCSVPDKVTSVFVNAAGPSLAAASNGDAIVVWQHAETSGGPRWTIAAWRQPYGSNPKRAESPCTRVALSGRREGQPSGKRPGMFAITSHRSSVRLRRVIE
jgi:hypothetical protein